MINSQDMESSYCKALAFNIFNTHLEEARLQNKLPAKGKAQLICNMISLFGIRTGYIP